MAHHALAQVEGSGALFVAGRILNTGGTLTVDQISTPLFFTGDVTVTDGGVGLPSLVVTNFLGPQGYAIPAITLTSTVAADIIGLNVGVTANSYSGETLTLAIQITSNGAKDAGLYFHIFAF